MLPAQDLAQGNQVVGIKFQIGMEMEWLDVMHLQAVALMTAGGTGRLFE